MFVKTFTLICTLKSRDATIEFKEGKDLGVKLRFTELLRFFMAAAADIEAWPGK